MERTILQQRPYHLTPAKNVFGLSIRRQAVNRGHYDDRQTSDNCYELIDIYGGEKANFDKKSDMPPMEASEEIKCTAGTRKRDDYRSMLETSPLGSHPCVRVPKICSRRRLRVAEASIVSTPRVSTFSLCFISFLESE